MNSTEHYEVIIPAHATKLDLFSAYADQMYLGESGIENWDWFSDLLLKRIKYSNIHVIVKHELPLDMNKEDQRIYQGIMTDLSQQFPDKISFC